MNPLWTAAKKQAMIKTRRVWEEDGRDIPQIAGWKDVERMSRCVIQMWELMENGNWQIWLENLYLLDMYICM